MEANKILEEDLIQGDIKGQILIHLIGLGHHIQIKETIMSTKGLKVPQLVEEVIVHLINPNLQVMNSDNITLDTLTHHNRVLDLRILRAMKAVIGSHTLLLKHKSN